MTFAFWYPAVVLVCVDVHENYFFLKEIKSTRYSLERIPSPLQSLRKSAPQAYHTPSFSVSTLPSTVQRYSSALKKKKKNIILDFERSQEAFFISFWQRFSVFGRQRFTFRPELFHPKTAFLFSPTSWFRPNRKIEILFSYEFRVSSASLEIIKVILGWNESP